ncbi:hypothetical protein CASFOL_032278 [Castilleja foliolosa]|uniref:Uncharacterized protein n=1 Tax=Castilleja foliolosa TaxID=1961234 RepID=A0ABD3C3S0_9LAMI
MTRNIKLRQSSSSASGRRQPLLENSDYSSRGGVRNSRFAEVAGRTTAECAAVCCCCPCGLVDLLVMAVYKLPAGICRKALRKKRRQRLAKMGLGPPRKCGCDENEMHIHAVTPTASMVRAMELSAENPEVMELDKEMTEMFYGGGFWRSPSRRNEDEAH